MLVNTNTSLLNVLQPLRMVTTILVRQVHVSPTTTSFSGVSHRLEQTNDRNRDGVWLRSGEKIWSRVDSIQCPLRLEEGIWYWSLSVNQGFESMNDHRTSKPTGW